MLMKERAGQYPLHRGLILTMLFLAMLVRMILRESYFRHGIDVRINGSMDSMLLQLRLIFLISGNTMFPISMMILWLWLLAVFR